MPAACCRPACRNADHIPHSASLRRYAGRAPARTAPPPPGGARPAPGRWPARSCRRGTPSPGPGRPSTADVCGRKSYRRSKPSCIRSRPASMVPRIRRSSTARKPTSRREGRRRRARSPHSLGERARTASYPCAQTSAWISSRVARQLLDRTLEARSSPCGRRSNATQAITLEWAKCDGPPHLPEPSSGSRQCRSRNRATSAGTTKRLSVVHPGVAREIERVDDLAVHVELELVAAAFPIRTGAEFS